MRSASSAFSSALCGSKRCKTEIERTLLATGQEGEEASAATGQAVGGSTISEVGHCATLRLPAFKIYWPSSQLILGGVEAVEARPYVLGYKHIAQSDAETWLVETPWSRVVEHQEKKQESQKENDRREKDVEHDDDAAQTTEYEPSKEEAEAGNQDEDREKVEPEDQKRQTPKEQDRKHNQEQAADDASDSDAGPVKKECNCKGSPSRSPVATSGCLQAGGGADAAASGCKGAVG